MTTFGTDDRQGNVMPYGSGQVVRQALIHAKPWQRDVICTAMILGGAGLAALGHVAGVLLAAAGALLIWRMLRYRLRFRLGGGRHADGIESH
jgi:hypothetical protein